MRKPAGGTDKFETHCSPSRKKSPLWLIKQTESPWLIWNPVTNLFTMKCVAHDLERNPEEVINVNL